MSKLAAVPCIVCGRPLSGTVEDDPAGDRPLTLTCGAHSDQDLRNLDLDELWGGERSGPRSHIFEDHDPRVVGVWEQGDGAYGVYILLDDGVLVMVFTWGLPSVSLALVSRDKRALAAPANVPSCTRAPWRRAIAEGWALRAAHVQASGGVRLDFGERGDVQFGTEGYSWRELGEYRHFLTETWGPVRS